MVTSPELMRQVHLDTYGEDDTRVEQALELRRRWLSVYPESGWGGSLWLEKKGVISEPIETVMIAWRSLNLSDYLDRKLIEMSLEDSRYYPPERYNVLVARLEGDRIVFWPHTLSLLDPYTLPVESL